MAIIVTPITVTRIEEVRQKKAWNSEEKRICGRPTRRCGQAQHGRTQLCAVFNIWTLNGKTCSTWPSLVEPDWPMCFAWDEQRYKITINAFQTIPQFSTSDKQSYLNCLQYTK